MALKIGDNFSYNGKKPLDARNQFSTIAEMTAFAETSLDEGHISYVKETGKYYTFNSVNDVDITLGKWRELNTGGSSSDEKVKLSTYSETAKYLNELVDNATIKVDTDNGVIKVINLDGLETTVATLNFVKSLDKDIMLYLNSISNPMTFKGVVADDETLTAIEDVKSGDTYIVQSSVSNADKTMTFIYNGTTFVPMAETNITVRDFTVEPIDLVTETTGTLPKAKIDAAIARLADVLDKTVYKGSADGVVKQADKLTGLTSTIANLNTAVTNSHKHTNKSVLDKIVANGIGDGFLADNGQYISFLHIGSTSPTYDSQLWVDNSDPTTPILKIYDGIAWVSISSPNSGGGGSSITVDSAMSDTSTNPVQNKVIKEYVDGKTVEISEETNNAIENKSDGIYVKKTQISTDENNALSEKDNGLYVQNLSNVVDNISYAQKTVNKGLDYICLHVSNTATTLAANSIIPFSIVANGNMETNSNNYSIKLKATKTYRISCDFLLDGSGYCYLTLYNLTNATTLAGFGKTASNYNTTNSDSSLDYIYTPASDCEVQIKTASTKGTCRVFNTYYSCAYFIVQEIGEVVTVDPLEYVNEDSGIEDTPVGHIIAHMGTTAPKHYLICDGAEYNIADYPNLAEHFKTDFGKYNYFGGDGVTTFAVPDLRAEFLRGSGTAIRNTGSGGKVGEHQDPTEHIALGYDAYYQTLYHGANGTKASTVDTLYDTWNNPDTTTNTTDTTGRSVKTTADYNGDGYRTFTSRPTNTSVLYCIKYEPTYYMQNTYNGNVYSTDEQIIGTWINGKPLYQKSFEFEAVKGEAITVLGKIEDMDLGFVDGGGSYYINTNVNYAAANTAFMLNSSGRGVDKATYTSYVVIQTDGTIVWYTGSDVATSGGVCTVKYTKNTN